MTTKLETKAPGTRVRQEQEQSGNKVRTKCEQKTRKIGTKIITNWNQSARVQKEAGKSGNRHPKIKQGSEKSRIKVGQEWEHSGNKARGKNGNNGNKVGTRTKWEQEPQSGARMGKREARMGAKWEQSGNKKFKVGQEWEKVGKK